MNLFYCYCFYNNDSCCYCYYCVTLNLLCIICIGASYFLHLWRVFGCRRTFFLKQNRPIYNRGRCNLSWNCSRQQWKRKVKKPQSTSVNHQNTWHDTQATALDNFFFALFVFYKSMTNINVDVHLSTETLNHPAALHRCIHVKTMQRERSTC